MRMKFKQKILGGLLATILLVMLGLLTWIRFPVSAHSELVSSEPEDGQVLSESPSQVRALFSEELETQTSSLQVIDSGGNQVDNGDGGADLDDLEHKTMLVSLPQSLPNGTYTVQWTAVSAEDEDAEQGEFTFVIGSTTTGDDSASQSQPGTTSWPLYGGIGLGIVLIAVVLFYINRQRNLEDKEA